MSSLVGHLSAGAAVYLSRADLRAPEARWALPLCMLLAICPDFDYPTTWFLGVTAHPRITHSLCFCALAGLLAWAVVRTVRHAENSAIGIGALLAAACSHLVLDLLVGVHSLPILWPLPLPEVMSPVGLLPSAGHPDISNCFLWRNLLIECGVLWPLFAGMVILCRGRRLRPQPWLALAPLWLGFVVWSIRIH
jgi:hypothetical protein